MGANDPQGVANLNARGMVGRIYIGNQYTILHTKYKNSWANGFRDFFSKLLCHFKSMGQWKLMTPLEHRHFGPQGHGWQDLCRGPLKIATY